MQDNSKISSLFCDKIYEDKEHLDDNASEYIDSLSAHKP